MTAGNKMDAVLCGIGGYGEWYLRSFLDDPESPIRFVGFVDPTPERSAFCERIAALGLPVHSSLDAFYADRKAELAIVASPIPFHAPQTICALEHGSHVLCEKPLCGTLAEAEAMRRAASAAERVVAIGYQASFLESTQRLKADVMNGVWGAPQQFKSLALCPRSREYYQRSGWAGRIKDSQGRWVLDSPVNNAVSHSLHHMLYLLGSSPTGCAMPVETQARLYRVHAIENYDTAVLRSRLEGGTEVFFVTTHAGLPGSPITPKVAYEFSFEGGTVTCLQDDGEIVGIDREGRRRSYGQVSNASKPKVLDTVSAIREGRAPLCGIEAAIGQTVCMTGVQDAGQPIVDIPHDRVAEVVVNGQHWLEVEGLDDFLMTAYRSLRLPAEGTI